MYGQQTPKFCRFTLYYRTLCPIRIIFLLNLCKICLLFPLFGRISPPSSAYFTALSTRIPVSFRITLIAPDLLKEAFCRNNIFRVTHQKFHHHLRLSTAFLHSGIILPSFPDNRSPPEVPFYFPSYPLQETSSLPACG